jgi:uncharacterized protein (DUF849 family)
MPDDAAKVLVKVCLNGGRSRREHPAVPLSAPELAIDAARAVAAGAGALHVHPRGPDGAETLDPGPCDEAVRAIRRACPGVPVGLTTGAWIEPDTERRLALVRSWTARPDFASVNFSEPGAVELCEALLHLEIGVEAGLASVSDAEALAGSDLADRCLRFLVEVEEEDQGRAVAAAAAIDEVLDRAGVARPRLHHGFGMATWAVLEAALDRRRDIRIGLEDTLQLPDGTPAPDNAGLIAAAVAMVHARGLRPTSPPRSLPSG